MARPSRRIPLLSFMLILGSSISPAVARNFSHPNSMNAPIFSSFDDRPPECPPCFNCQLDAFTCTQFAECMPYNGKCACPPGFGGDDCSEPMCGSLADDRRSPRKEKYCECHDGWAGATCNVCRTNDACNALMPEGEDGVCYTQGLVVRENHQMCDVTNRKIVDQLKERKPQVTFSCETTDNTCNFQCELPRTRYHIQT